MRFRALSLSSNSKHATAHLCVCVAVLFAWASPAPVGQLPKTLAPHRATEAEIDAALQRAATLALGGRDGTIVLMDAQTGRLRAAVNEQLATEGAYPPGSAIKPFTLLAALRKGIVGADTRLLCRKHYKRGATEFSCSHPVYKTLFDTAHALAHSCNYFFAHLGERLTTEEFDATLAPFGFGATDARADTTAHDATARDARAHAASPRTAAPRDAARRDATRGDAARRAALRLARRAASKRAGAGAGESDGARLPRGEWHTETALGEGGAILVTPLQLITAYAALANGGRLFDARRDAPAGYQPRERARLSISDEERALIVAGMRGAVSYGTAERARLDALPSRVFGKTGTATEIGGFRTHGWFVGFASDPRATNGHNSQDAARVDDDASSSSSPARYANNQPAPSEVRLAVLVFLKRSQGKDCAEIARPIFEEYARLTSGEAQVSSSTNDEAAAASDVNGSPVGVLTENLDDADTSGHVGTNSVDDASSRDDANSIDGANSVDGAAIARHDSSHTHNGADVSRGGSAARGDETVVRVRLARDGETVSMSLGEYLFGVLAAEGSTEDEYNALKALAVVARTYALGKLGRHAREGFDFCTTTHCERFLRVNASNARPDFHALLRRAVAETSGEVLRDSRGHLANAYFSASCGGMTANVQTLWGEPAREPFERGVADEYCAALPQTRWTDVIPARDLAAALRADPRSDVGSRLDSVTVARRDATGRAELVALAGERRRTLRGWDFKIIVGRTLGWSVVKSSRFTVERAGSSFVFRGTGFGHGLGLCQAGAHVMARGGSSYLQILAHYFPGASVGPLSAARASAEERTQTHDERLPSRDEWQLRAPDEQQAAPRWKADATAPLSESVTLLRRALASERHSHATQSDSHGREYYSRPTPSYSHAEERHSGGRESYSGVTECRFPVRESHSRAREWRFLVRESHSLAWEYDSHARESHSESWARRTLRGERYPTSYGYHSSRAGEGSPARLTLSSEHFRVSFPARVDRRAAESVLRTLEDARSDIARRLDAASLPQPSLPTLEINVNETTAAFVAATGQPSFVAAATRGARVELQPIAALERRGVLAQTLRHEYAHACIDALSRSRAPHWLAEGLAAHFAGEGAMLARRAPAKRMSVEEIERGLEGRASPEQMRALYAAAYAEVRALVRAEGEPRVWRRVAGS